MRSEFDFGKGETLMGIEIRVPALGESVTEATVGKWYKKPGDAVKADEPLVELETDKVTIEIPAPASGVMGEILVKQGTTVAIGALLAGLNEGAAAAAMPTAAPMAQPASAPAAKAATTQAAPAAPRTTEMPASPAARKAMTEAGLSEMDVSGTGKRDRKSVV